MKKLSFIKILNLFNIFKKINFAIKKKPEDNELAKNIVNGDNLSIDQTSMISNLLELGNIEVSDVMVPRADIVAISNSSDIKTVLNSFLKASHSRMPIYDNNLDNIIGMIHVKDLLPFWSKQTNFSIDKVKRNVLFSSPSMLVADLLGQMRATRLHMAIIVDEHGGTDGIVTIEDLVEEIVGEIEDEHDVNDDPKIILKEDGTFVMSARTKVFNLERALGVSFNKIDLDEDFDTVGGLIFSILGRVPSVGEIISDIKTGVNFKVLEAEPRMIKKVSVSRGEVQGAGDNK